MKIIQDFIKSKYAIRKILIMLVVFILIPFIINGGLILSDFIYRHTGCSLTAYGLSNSDWFNFWQNYCNIFVVFIGVYLVWNSSNEDRKSEKQREIQNLKMNELQKEEAVMVEIVESLEIGVAYNSVCKWIANKYSITEAMYYLNEAENRINVAHIKFELLTDISMNYESGECAESNKCINIEQLKAHRDLYYKLENEYIDLIKSAQSFIINNEGTLNIEGTKDFKNIVDKIEMQADIVNTDRAVFIRYCKCYVDHKRQQIFNAN